VGREVSLKPREAESRGLDSKGVETRKAEHRRRCRTRGDLGGVSLGEVSLYKCGGISERRPSESALEEKETPLEFLFATLELGPILLTLVCDFFRNVNQPRFVFIGPFLKAPLPFVVGKIKVEGVVLLNAALLRTLINVPADEIRRIAEVTPIRTKAARGTLVLGPGTIDRLRIALSRCRSRTRNHPKYFRSWWLRFGFET
jgi:hypothetical protein